MSYSGSLFQDCNTGSNYLLKYWNSMLWYLYYWPADIPQREFSPSLKAPDSWFCVATQTTLLLEHTRVELAFPPPTLSCTIYLLKIGQNPLWDSFTSPGLCAFPLQDPLVFSRQRWELWVPETTWLEGSIGGGGNFFLATVSKHLLNASPCLFKNRWCLCSSYGKISTLRSLFWRGSSAPFRTDWRTVLADAPCPS